MRTMNHTYWVEVAFLNTESDDINVCQSRYSNISRKKIRKEGSEPLFLNSVQY